MLSMSLAGSSKAIVEGGFSSLCTSGKLTIGAGPCEIKVNGTEVIGDPARASTSPSCCGGIVDCAAPLTIVASATGFDESESALPSSAVVLAL